MQIWSERFDGNSSDLFALQDQITGRIANSIGAGSTTSPRARRDARADPNAIDLLMRGIAIADWPQSLDNLQQQELLFGQAVLLDPDSSEAHARLARAILLQLIQVHASMPMQTKADKLRQGAQAAETAIALDQNNARAHLASGLLHMARGEFAEAVLANETAIALDRNLALAHSNLGNSLIHLGQAREALLALAEAIRLDPHGPQIAATQSAMGLARMFLGEFQAAMEWYSRARSSNAKLARAHAGLAIALALTGEIERAARRSTGPSAFVSGLSHLWDDRRSVCIIAISVPAFYEHVLGPAAKAAGVPV